jgi:hypothetical protein
LGVKKAANKSSGGIGGLSSIEFGFSVHRVKPGARAWRSREPPVYICMDAVQLAMPLCRTSGLLFMPACSKCGP